MTDPQYRRYLQVQIKYLYDLLRAWDKSTSPRVDLCRSCKAAYTMFLDLRS